MHFLPKRAVRLLNALVWSILVVTACSVLAAGEGGVDLAVSALRLGTSLWSYQCVSNMFAAAWSSDSHFLAIGEANGTVQVRDAVTGTITLSLHGHTGAVWSVAWSPDGKRLASVADDIQVWQAS